MYLNDLDQHCRNTQTTLLTGTLSGIKIECATALDIDETYRQFRAHLVVIGFDLHVQARREEACIPNSDEYEGLQSLQ